MGNQLSHGLGLLLPWSPWVSQQCCGSRRGVCVLQPSPELVLRTSALGSGTSWELWHRHAMLVLSPLLPFEHPLHFQGFLCPRKTVSGFKTSTGTCPSHPIVSVLGLQPSLEEPIGG